MTGRSVGRSAGRSASRIGIGYGRSPVPSPWGPLIKLKISDLNNFFEYFCPQLTLTPYYRLSQYIIAIKSKAEGGGPHRGQLGDSRQQAAGVVPT